VWRRCNSLRHRELVGALFPTESQFGNQRSMNPRPASSEGDIGILFAWHARAPMATQTITYMRKSRHAIVRSPPPCDGLHHVGGVNDGRDERIAARELAIGEPHDIVSAALGRWPKFRRRERAKRARLARTLRATDDCEKECGVKSHSVTHVMRLLRLTHRVQLQRIPIRVRAKPAHSNSHPLSAATIVMPQVERLDSPTAGFSGLVRSRELRS